MTKKVYSLLFMVGAIVLLVSSVLVMEHVLWGKYAFAAGCALFIVSRMQSVYSGSDFRLKRLNRLYFMSSLLLLGVSYMQFKDMNSWVVVLLMVALTELYAALRTSWYEKAIREEKADRGEEASDEATPNGRDGDSSRKN